MSDFTLVCLTESRPTTYSLEGAAHLAGVHPEMLRYYCRVGLFGKPSTGPDGEPVFDDDLLFKLRRVEHTRRLPGMNRSTVRLICGLWREIERLQDEIRFLRDP